MEPLPATRSLKTNVHTSVGTLRGFTIIELLVVFAIIGVISAVVITTQGSFDRTITLANTAFDVALTLRDAEVYGLGSRGVGTVANAGYGVDFSASTPSSFTFFADTYPPLPSGSKCHPITNTPADQPGDCAYSANKDQIVETYTIGNNITIYNFCAKIGSVWKCKSNNSLNSLDIVFARPNPTPLMSVDGTYSNSPLLTEACLDLISPQRDQHRYVTILYSGEIDASAPSCP